MAKGFINDSTLTAIADAIRTKNGTTAKLLPSAMAAAISALGGQIATGTVSISNTSPSEGVTICSVSGLKFTPKIVVLYLNNNVSIASITTTSGKGYPSVIVSGAVNRCVYTTKSSGQNVAAIICLTNNNGLSIVDNGFLWESTLLTTYYPPMLSTSYGYIAIG